MNKTSAQTLSVKVSSPAKVYLEGQAQSVTAVNDTGEFDVLPGHHNFISLLNPCTLRIVQQSTTKELPIESGIIHIKDNDVSVFLDI